VRTYLVFFTLRSGNRPLLRLAILTSTDRSCFPAFIILIHYIWFSGVAFPGESKALSADNNSSPLKQFKRLQIFSRDRCILAHLSSSRIKTLSSPTDDKQAP
jgi:hypothetical protein